MWEKIMIPMYRLWLHGLCGLYGPRCLLSPERPLNFITHSLAWTVPNHYLNQCWNIVDWTFGNKLLWNFYQNPIFSFNKMHFKISSAKWRQFCLSLNVLTLPMLPCSALKNVSLWKKVRRNSSALALAYKGWLSFLCGTLSLTSDQDSILLNFLSFWRSSTVTTSLCFLLLFFNAIYIGSSVVSSAKLYF